MSDVTLSETPLEFSSGLDEDDAARKLDTLNLIPYAEVLRDFIHACETPLTIGIRGDWGVGRTSLMNMLRGSGDGGQSGLLDAKHCKAISFDSWPFAQFDQNDHMGMACLFTLTEKLGAALVNESLINTGDLDACLKGAKQRLSSSMQRIRNLSVTVSGDHDEEVSQTDISSQMLIFRSEFAALVSLWTQSHAERRIVMFIDDLDRIHPARALELLETVKNFVDVPGCVFVMALDYEVVQRGMLEKLGQDLQKTSGKALFDKMIQLPFIVPTTSYRLDDYIVDLLQKAGMFCVKKVSLDAESRQFFHDITLYTVGRNPRSIKRVINQMNLLERIHHHNAGHETTHDECKILFALVSMQTAWPELFEYLIRDPSVDTITSLQSWDYLDDLPEAVSLFERSPDRERVKIAISAFFDTLFSLLDENDDGQVDTRELQPVLDVMHSARIASAEGYQRPRDWFIRLVQKNNDENNPLITSFLEKVFMKSVWYLGSEIKYRRAGHRYITLVVNRQQIGTLISLKSQPLVFRLAMSPERVMIALKEYWKSKHSVKTEAITLVRNTFGSEASLTGYGDTLVDFSKMTNMPSSEAIKLLNALFRIVTR